SNHVRKEIHRLAVRGPTAPTVSLTSDLDGKGAATGKTAVAAGAVWLGGTMQAAGDAAEAAPLVLALGLVTTPFAVAGGALYGAAVADSAEAIAEGNQTLSGVLDFAPDRFRAALERQFAAQAPIEYAFTPEASDEELAARGFDAVLDIRMESLVSAPSENRLRTHFTQSSRAELRVFNRPDLDRTRHYSERLSERAVSSWAKNDGRLLLADLDASYAETAADVVDDFFLKKAIRVQGIEPVSRGWSAGTISGTLPMFVWSARDGARQQPDDDVNYEVMIYAGRKAPESGTLTKTSRYVPPEPLQACRTYNWRVRAHYESFGQPEVSDWSPGYRFKTPCKRGKR
ncbi:MAG TPA: hypothetical protein VIS76_12020, partial [Pseudomonadales bacterium]